MNSATREPPILIVLFCQRSGEPIIVGYVVMRFGRQGSFGAYLHLPMLCHAGWIMDTLSIGVISES